MERFALVGVHEQIDRYIETHPLLRLLPIGWAKFIIPKGKAIFTETIYKKGCQDELGYMLYVPGFHVKQGKYEESHRIKVIQNLIDVLATREIKVLVFPLWRRYLSIEEKNYLEENSITLLDGGIIRLISLLDTVQRLFAMLRATPNEMEVGIWGADNIVGKLWTEFLAPHLNNLVIGGNDIHALEELSNEILYNTGLSCQITSKPHYCLKNKSMIILTSFPEGWEKPEFSRLTVLSYGLGKESCSIYEADSKGIFIGSGFPSIPENLQTSIDLSPWDQVGILEATLFIMEEPFRRLLENSPLTMDNIKKIKEILKRYGITSAGMISKNSFLSYDGFRRAYFGNFLDKINDSIL